MNWTFTLSNSFSTIIFFCPCFKVLRDILKEVQGNMVPRSMLKEWALHTFPNATDYWTFRKMFTIQLALIGLAEFMLHLNRLNPEMLQIAQVPEWLDVMEMIPYLILALFHQIYMYPLNPKQCVGSSHMLQFLLATLQLSAWLFVLQHLRQSIRSVQVCRVHLKVFY